MADVTPIGVKLRERREQTLRSLLDAQNANDMAAALACFDYPRYELIGNQRVYDGVDEVRRYWEVTRRYFPDLRFEVIEVHHGEDAVVCELWMSGTHPGLGPRLRGHGAALPVPERHHLRLRRRAADRRPRLLRHRHHRPPARLRPMARPLADW